MRRSALNSFCVVSEAWNIVFYLPQVFMFDSWLLVTFETIFCSINIWIFFVILMRFWHSWIFSVQLTFDFFFVKLMRFWHSWIFLISWCRQAYGGMSRGFLSQMLEIFCHFLKQRLNTFFSWKWKDFSWCSLVRKWIWISRNLMPSPKLELVLLENEFIILLWLSPRLSNTFVYNVWCGMAKKQHRQLSFQLAT